MIILLLQKIYAILALNGAIILNLSNNKQSLTIDEGAAVSDHKNDAWKCHVLCRYSCK